MDDKTEKSLRAQIADLEKQLRQSGRDLDDRFRGAVDPIGEDIREQLGVAKSRDWTVAIRVIAGVVIAVAVYFVVRLFI
jgi:hypothetical protein